MLDRIKQFFDNTIMQASPQAGELAEHELRLATAALLIEMTRADFGVNHEEMQAVCDALQRTFELTTQETDELVALAEEEVRQSASLFEFTHLVDKAFDLEQKIHVVELLWRVAYSDSHLCKHEEHLVRKLADLLHVPHRDFLRTKHAVQAAMQQ
jgi:uncharacterized tellurite resistance protein B-like protein